MSIKIQLKYSVKYDLEFLSVGISLRLIRLISMAQIKMKSGWSRPYDVIIDTGNPVSVIPRFIWEYAETKLLHTEDAHLFGIGKGNVSGKLGEITMILGDEKKISKPILAKAFLINNDTTPFLIGFEDILTSFSLYSDFTTNSAHLVQKATK